MIKPPGKPGIALYFSSKTTKTDTYGQKPLLLPRRLSRRSQLAARTPRRVLLLLGLREAILRAGHRRLLRGLRRLEAIGSPQAGLPRGVRGYTGLYGHFPAPRKKTGGKAVFGVLCGTRHRQMRGGVRFLRVWLCTQNLEPPCPLKTNPKKGTLSKSMVSTWTIGFPQHNRSPPTHTKKCTQA